MRKILSLNSELLYNEVKSMNYKYIGTISRNENSTIYKVKYALNNDEYIMK